MKRILFVDDEPSLLRGLERSFYKQRDRWTMVFVESGAEALVELAKAPFDVLVSDMRMPGLDGTALLQRVKDESPNVARIVLSGDAAPERVAEARTLVHHFFAKPCPTEVLRAAIAHVCGQEP